MYSSTVSVEFDDLVWLVQTLAQYRMRVIDGEVAPVESLRVARKIDDRFKKYLS
ncbi:hypothetical protein [Microvirus mar53]|uniref:Uncharacterized protein n=1 Tax=Microvirus mar53 TaxID=2851189 RepID=A0A8F5XPK3_9VIRU|nr:hypothetical protein [Microvirus mar53]